MKKLIDLNTWSRKDHFNLFSRFEEPFFGVCIRVDCTRAYSYCKEHQYSFFLYYLHCSLKAANEVAPFRYRIIDGQPWEFEQVHASPTINRPDGTFGFGYLDYYPEFNEFLEHASPAVKKVQADKGLIPGTPGQNMIHYSSIPWLDFTSLSHARSFSFNDSCPKISFGKMTEADGKRSMPVSIHVHHALMDGYQVGQFVSLYQQILDSKF